MLAERKTLLTENIDRHFYLKSERGCFLSFFKSLKQWIGRSCDNSLFTPPSDYMRLCSGQAFCLPPVSTLVFLAITHSRLILKHETCVCLHQTASHPCLFVTYSKQLEATDSHQALQGLQWHHVCLSEIPKVFFMPVLLTEWSSVYPICWGVLRIYKKCRKLSERQSVWPCQPLCIRDESASSRRFILHPCGRVVYPPPFFWQRLYSGWSH